MHIQLLDECGGVWIDNYMSNDYHGEGIWWIFSGYPHDECAYALTETGFSSGQYNVFGIKPGDEIGDAVSVLENQGFMIKDGAQKTYAKGDLCITLSPNRPPLDGYGQEGFDRIHTIIISVRTFYLGNFLY